MTDSTTPKPAARKSTPAKSTAARPSTPRKPATATPASLAKTLSDATKALADQKRKEANAATAALNAQTELQAKEREDIQIAARAIEQDRLDEIAVREAAAARLNYIVHGVNSPVETPAADSTTSVDDDAPTTITDPPVAPPATETVKTVPIKTETPEPQEALGLPKQTEQPKKKTIITRTKVIRDRVAAVSGYSWAGAIFVGIVTFLVIMSIGSGFFPGRPEILRILTAIAIFIALFFIGGLIGRLVGVQVAKNKAKMASEVTVKEKTTVE
jgi:hypothetical protein